MTQNSEVFTFLVIFFPVTEWIITSTKDLGPSLLVQCVPFVSSFVPVWGSQVILLTSILVCFLLTALLTLPFHQCPALIKPPCSFYQFGLTSFPTLLESHKTRLMRFTMNLYDLPRIRYLLLLCTFIYIYSTLSTILFLFPVTRSPYKIMPFVFKIM